MTAPPGSVVNTTQTVSDWGSAQQSVPVEPLWPNIMNTYGFTFTLKENATSTERVAEAIYAICNDVSVGSREGIVHAAFDRDADSLDSAIRSAASDVAKAGFAVSHVDIDDETLEKIAC